VNQPVQVTFVCRKCHNSFVAEKKEQPPTSFFSRLFGGGTPKQVCPKCGSKDLAEADSAPLTTKQYRKKQG
jgi:predicted nucleic-acid-binding Zn-ribbon protein